MCDEGLDSYKLGGYAPVEIGAIYGGYEVLYKIGFGHFSTVWECAIMDDPEADHVALKIQKSSPTYSEAALDEITLLQKLNESLGENDECHVTRLLDTFTIDTENGTHHCMVFPLLGHSVLTLIRRYQCRGLPIPIVKYITRQVLQGLSDLHDKAGIIHTDIKPENILLVNPPVSSRTGKPYNDCLTPVTALQDADETQEAFIDKIRESNKRARSRRTSVHLTDFSASIADLGNACWVDRLFCDVIQTRQYRAPEVILGQTYGPAADVFSLGCCVFEMLTGDLLFDPKEKPNVYSRDEDHLALMFELFGRPEITSLTGKNCRLFFNRTGQLKRIRTLKFIALRTLLTDTYGIPAAEANGATDLITAMLLFDPVKRPRAAELVGHEWLCDDENDRAV